MTEHTANQELARAAQRIEWEDEHSGAWMQPAPARNTAQRSHRACDAVLLVLLCAVMLALTLGVL